MKYDSPFMKFLESAANMLIVSVLWLLFSLPVVTIAASSAAAYHTVNKVVFGEGRGNGVFRDFYETFKLNLKPGIALSLIAAVSVLLILEGLWTGYQIMTVSIWGLLYMILGVAVAATVGSVLVIMPAVLSRFDAGTMGIIRLSAYFAMKRPFRRLLSVALLAALVLAVQLFPLALFIAPALFADIIRPRLELDFDEFIRDNGLLEEPEEREEEGEEEPGYGSESVFDLESGLREDGKGGKDDA